jgi:hypothetical protein
MAGRNGGSRGGEEERAVRRAGGQEQRDGARERGALAGGARWRVQVLGKDSQPKGGDDERDIEES